MPVGDQEHGGIAVAMPAGLRRLDQLLDLGRGQVFTRP